METQKAPTLIKEEVITIALKALQEQKWLYDVAYGLQPAGRGFNARALGQKSKPVGLWSVNFLTPAGPLDQESRFVEIDDETSAPLGIMTAHNYFFL